MLASKFSHYSGDIEKLRCRLLWSDQHPALSKAGCPIVDPIRESLRKRNLLFLISHGPPRSDKEIAELFGEQTEFLEQTLGRLLLKAVINDDREFSKRVACAIRDLNAIFRRGKLNSMFSTWLCGLSVRRANEITRGEVKKEFEEYINRALRSSEWVKLKKIFSFEIEQIPCGRPGRKPKAKKTAAASEPPGDVECPF